MNTQYTVYRHTHTHTHTQTHTHTFVYMHPNWDDARFINRLISILLNMNSHHLIAGCDLNCVMDPALDPSVSPSRMARTFMNEAGCKDPWRFLFPPHNKEFILFTWTSLLFNNRLFFNR